jgi:hypothetical protein
MADMQESSPVFFSQWRKERKVFYVFLLCGPGVPSMYSGQVLRESINVYSGSDIGTHFSISNFPDFR